MSEKERIEEIRSYLKFNKKTFSEILGYTYPQQYTKYLNGTNSLSIKAIKALIKHNNQFNINWVLTGEGNMFISNAQKIINGDNNDTQIGHIRNTSNSNNKNININSHANEIELLKSKIEFLEKALEDKDERIKDKDERLKDREEQLRDKDELIAILKKNQK